MARDKGKGSCLGLAKKKRARGGKRRAPVIARKRKKHQKTYIEVWGNVAELEKMLRR